MRRLLFKSLVHGPLTEAAPLRDDAALAELAAQVNRAAHWRLGRTLSIREVDAGSCNGCELEIHALNNVLYDLERFGLRFVASPRHADVLLVTGPVTTNMREALERTYQATPNPKWVVAVGDCATGRRRLLWQLRLRRRRRRCPARRLAHRRLPAVPDQLTQRSARTSRARRHRDGHRRCRGNERTDRTRCTMIAKSL